MTAPRVVVVVVAYGHAAHIPATLRSVLGQRYPSDQIEVVVVDNGDGTSAAAARLAAPSAAVLTPERNLGFAGGCNLAVDRGSGDVVLLVNPDVELHPEALAALVAALDEPGVGVVGAKLLFPDGDRIQHAGGELRLPLALTAHRGYRQPDGPAFATPYDAQYVTGAALATRRSTWQLLGGLDESFAPAYFEEVDFCLRVRAAGLQVRYCAAAVGQHHEASALGRASAAYYRLYHANRLRLLFKHWDDAWLVREWLPAELSHLRAVADDNEIDGLLWSYLIWQAHYAAGAATATAPLDGWQTEPAETGAPAASELGWTLDQIAAKRTVRPLPFTSSLPGVARIRAWVVKLVTEAYLRPVIQQQNDLNASLAEFAVAIERQRRTADGAVLCQGLLLAKLIAGGEVAGRS